MKRIIFLTIGIVFLFACEKETLKPIETTSEEVVSDPVSDLDDGTESSGSMSCVLNGEEWTASSCAATYIIEDDIELNQLSVSGVVDGFLINLGMKGLYEMGSVGLDLGTYEGEIDSHNGFVIIQESFEIVGSAPGIDIGFVTITLTEFDFDTYVCSGTFEFSATTTENPDEIGFEVTDGVFENVPFMIL